MKDKYFIYGLVDPRDGRIRYVGKTRNLQGRIRKHLRGIETGKARSCWIEELRILGMKPSVTVLQKTSKDGWKEAERFQIAFFRSRGLADLNATRGGDGVDVLVHTEGAKQKMSCSHKEHWQDPDYAERVRESHRTAKFRENQSRVMRERFSDPSELEKMRERVREESSRPERKQRFKELMQSPEVIQKRKATLGRVMADPEVRKKISEAAKRRGPRSAETRSKISRAAVLLWSNPEHRARMLPVLKNNNEKRKKNNADTG